MICQCGNSEATFSKSGFVRNKNGQREYYEYCNVCGDAGPVYVPDVFWNGKPEENLADGDDGKPRVFLSKGQKAMYLREKGIREAGDKFHGAPNTVIVSDDKGARKLRNKEEVIAARRKVESMSRDYRHNEFMRLTRGK